MTETDVPLAEELAQLAARMTPLLLTLDTVTTAVGVLASLAQETIAGATGAGLSLLDEDGRRTSTGSTSDVTQRADDLQYQLDEGPCLTSWTDQVSVRIDDIDYDPRWPRWSVAVRELPLLSSLSVPLVADRHRLGAVKVYSDQRAAFDDRAERLLHGFADTAALLLANAATLDSAQLLSDTLRQAVLDRDAVQLATGVVMQRDQLSRSSAFQQLVDTAQTRNQTVLAVAQSILDAAGPSS